MNFKNKTVVITGASRGIGHAIGLKMAALGANIAILAKTIEANPKIPGTIYSAAEDMIQAGGNALPLATDIRFEDQVTSSFEKIIENFGGIDILVNNASAIYLGPTLETDMKKFDLIHSINIRGTYLCSKLAIPYLLKSENPHVLTLSPPLKMNPEWFKGHVAYTISKYGMSMCVLGLAEEYKNRIAFNALWPRTTIATAVISNILGGKELIKRSRKPTIMADAALKIFEKNAKDFSGHFLVDEEFLRTEGVLDFSVYKMNPELREADLQQDLYI